MIIKTPALFRSSKTNCPCADGHVQQGEHSPLAGMQMELLTQTQPLNERMHFQSSPNAQKIHLWPCHPLLLSATLL